MSAADEIVTIHTDGGCRPNPGPGGWGAVLRFGAHVRELYGGEPDVTTNNRMELTAPIMALETLNRSCEVHVYTDSTYVRSGITSWLAGWKRNGWMTRDRKPVKNQELWQALDVELARHQVRWVWVKGHAGDPGNEKADELANRLQSEKKSTYFVQPVKEDIKD